MPTSLRDSLANDNDNNLIFDESVPISARTAGHPTKPELNAQTSILPTAPKEAQAFSRQPWLADSGPPAKISSEGAQATPHETNRCLQTNQHTLKMTAPKEAQAFSRQPWLADSGPPAKISSEGAQATPP